MLFYIDDHKYNTYTVSYKRHIKTHFKLHYHLQIRTYIKQYNFEFQMYRLGFSFIFNLFVISIVCVIQYLFTNLCNYAFFL